MMKIGKFSTSGQQIGSSVSGGVHSDEQVIIRRSAITITDLSQRNRIRSLNTPDKNKYVNIQTASFSEKK